MRVEYSLPMVETASKSVDSAVQQRSLRVKLTLFVAGVIVLTSGAVGWVGYVTAKNVLKEQIEGRLRVAANDRRAMLLAYVNQQHERIGLVASRTQLRRLTQQMQEVDAEERTAISPGAEVILRDAMAATDGFLEISMLDPGGELLASTNPEPNADELATSLEFIRGRVNRHLGLPRAEGDRFVALLSAPALNDEKKLIGVVVARIDVTPLHTLLADSEGLGETGEVLVGYSEGDTVHYLFPARGGQTTTTSRGQVAAMVSGIAGDSGFVQATDYRDEEVYAIFAPVAYQDPKFRKFGMVAKSDVNEVLAPVKRLRNWLLLLNAGLLLCGVVAAVVLSRRISSPLAKLTDQAKVAADGDLSSLVSIHSRDEIGALAAAFNTMITNLRKSQEELEHRVEQRTAELAVAQDENVRQTERTRRVIETATDAFVAMDDNGTIVDWNPAAESTFGWTSEEAIGQTVAALLVPEELRNAHTTGLQRYLTTGEGPVLGNTIEVTALHKDGREIPVELNINPLKSKREVRFNAFVRDISQRKDAEKQLHVAKEAAEAASRAKSDFLANMSHEIRTPMNAVLGMSELMLDTEIDETQRSYLQTVMESAEHLMIIINEILDFSRIEAGRVELETHPFNLREALGDTMKVFAFRAHRKGLEIACRVAVNVPNGVVGDVARLRQIIINLVGNAIKFTSEGEVLLDVSLQSPVVDNSAKLRFSIRDTGIGIPPDRIERVFDSFTQADNSTTRNFGGTGLGLTISKQLVELMGGEISAESREGEGSTFSFTLPVKVAEDSASFQPAALLDVAGVRILVVDDNKTNCQIVSELLRPFGVQCTSVFSAESALHRIERAHRGNQPYQLVLTDLHMPEMDGLELVAKIRELAAIDQPEIIMLTSGERPGDAALRKQLGVAACLMKPVKQSELIDELSKCLGSQQPVSSEDIEIKDENLPVISRQRILVAEDGEANRMLLEILLTKWGHTAKFAVNGLAAVEKFGSDAFDLILMDVEMPEMDGFQATQRIREMEAKSQADVAIPIIALTAHAMQGDRQRCLDAGMNDYVTKPIRKRDLMDAIARVVDGRALPPLPNVLPNNGSTTRPAPTDNETVNSDNSPPAKSRFDISTAREALGGDDELLQIVVRAFLDESPKLLSDLRTAAGKADMNAMRIAAHALKGSVRYYGETDAHRLAEQLELTAADGSLAAEASPDTKLDELEQAVRELQQTLQPFAEMG